MSGPSIDPQATGWYDDGNEQGAIRTRLVRGNLVPIPFHALQYYPELIGTAATAYQTQGVWSNPDGSGTGINVTVPAGLVQGVTIWMPFYGRAFGVRFRRDTASMPAFTVNVDGNAVRVDTQTIPLLSLEGITSQLNDAEARAITHDHLAEGQHHAELIFNADPISALSLTLYGLLLDERAGYRALPRVAQHLPSTVLTTSAVEIPTGRSTVLAMRAIRKVKYVNTSASPVTVTVKLGSNVLEVFYLGATGAAGDCGQYDPGTATAVNATMTHQASANTSVTATVIGEY